LHNLAIGVLRVCGHTSIAAALLRKQHDHQARPVAVFAAGHGNNSSS
jgi:hypothetical protein